MSIVVVWYFAVPLAGGYYIRYKWRKFRTQFVGMMLSPLLDYRRYRQADSEGKVFRFMGEIESITNTHTLWVKGKDLTIPVLLEPESDSHNGDLIKQKDANGNAAPVKAKCYLLPKHDGEGEQDAPEQIRWNRVSTLSEGIKVFAGGELKMHSNRLIFSSSKEKPLTVVFYSCPDDKLTEGIIRAARTRNEYWNSLTPISLAVGALSLIYIASMYLNRPAYFLYFICAFAAVFIPIFPFLPPGILFTVLYRRFSWYSRRQRIHSDLAYYKHLSGNTESQGSAADRPPEMKRYAVRAYSTEVIAWVLMIMGVILNIIFMFLILIYLRIISF